MGWSAPEALIALQNPISVERSVLRPSLAPGAPRGGRAQREPPDPRRARLRDRPDLRASSRGGRRPSRPRRALGRGGDDGPARGPRLARRAASAWTSTTPRARPSWFWVPPRWARRSVTPYAPGKGPRYLEEGRAAALTRRTGARSAGSARSRSTCARPSTCRRRSSSPRCR